MSRHDVGPVFYREIQKNGFLKRIPTDTGGKLRNKKAPLKPMWTVFCIHNGRTPYLEQYPSPAAHQPSWLECLGDTRHVTAGLTHDFCVTTQDTQLTLRAHDWESMQDWVTTLRSKLVELRVLPQHENVYCAAPIPPQPVIRGGTRDPASPLPPTPADTVPRIPGIEIAPMVQQPQTQPVPEPQPTEQQPPIPQPFEPDSIPWDQALQSLPSTSTKNPEPSLAKICGQNICLDDSVLRRNDFDSSDSECDYTQRVVINDVHENNGEFSGTNVTVIKVSNKGPPHSAIPVIGETDVFQFDFKQNVNVNDNFVNIVNTEDNPYGCVFDGNYGHVSLTTNVKVDNDSVYERLCMASTVKNDDRKTSLPNLNVNIKESPYECLFPNDSSIDIPNLNVRQTNTDSNSNNSRTNTTNSHFQTNIISNPNASRNNITNITTSSSVPNSNNSRITVTTSNIPNTNSNTRPTNSISNIRNTPLNNSTASNSIRSNSNATRSNASIPIDTSNRSIGIERSNSQSSENGLRERLLRRNQIQGPKISKSEPKPAENQQKPIWKRGLTELSLLTKIRGIALNRSDRDGTHDSNERITPVKAVHRSRGDSRADNSRRRSSSLNNGTPQTLLQSLRMRQAATLQAEQSCGASIVARVPRNDLPIFAEASGCVWVAKWGRSGATCSGRTGDRVSAVRGVTPRDIKHIQNMIKDTRTHMIDILFQRVPHGKIFVLNKKSENQNIGIKLDNECHIVSIDPLSPAQDCGLPLPGKWSLTEVNNRQINLVKGGEEEMTRLSSCGSEVSILIQPSLLVKKLRAAVKANKNILNIRS